MILDALFEFFYGQQQARRNSLILLGFVFAEAVAILCWPAAAATIKIVPFVIFAGVFFTVGTATMPTWFGRRAGSLSGDQQQSSGEHAAIEPAQIATESRERQEGSVAAPVLLAESSMSQDNPLVAAAIELGRIVCIEGDDSLAERLIAIVRSHATLVAGAAIVPGAHFLDMITSVRAMLVRLNRELALPLSDALADRVAPKVVARVGAMCGARVRVGWLPGIGAFGGGPRHSFEYTITTVAAVVYMRAVIGTLRNEASHIRDEDVTAIVASIISDRATLRELLRLSRKTDLR